MSEKTLKKVVDLIVVRSSGGGRGATNRIPGRDSRNRYVPASIIKFVLEGGLEVDMKLVFGFTTGGAQAGFSPEQEEKLRAGVIGSKFTFETVGQNGRLRATGESVEKFREVIGTNTQSRQIDNAPHGPSIHSVGRIPGGKQTPSKIVTCRG